MAERIKGTVKWFNETKGFGFISREGGKDLFVHYSALENTGSSRPSLNEGDAVEFEEEQTPKGLNATHVVQVQ
ncbi:MAG: cold shock domain-containing protein [Anaerolineae bacterium]